MTSCYYCKKELKDTTSFFCNVDCKAKYWEREDIIRPKTKLTIPQIQEKLKRISKD